MSHENLAGTLDQKGRRWQARCGNCDWRSRLYWTQDGSAKAIVAHTNKMRKEEGK